MSSHSHSHSDSNELKLLAIGDVHLGTRPGSLPESLDEGGVDLHELTPEAALAAAAERAIELGVDGVLFAGDVVESTNARFEALRPLEQVVRRLLEQGIPVLAVGGNHDVDALPRLADLIEGFELIGRGGQWQSRVIEKRGDVDGAVGLSVEILGWSFPERRVRNSPIATLLRSPIPPSRPGIARLGLLHADLDASGGSYAPITSRELSESGLDAWLLGHIHKPSLTGGEAESADGAGPRGYLGSLVGLDPSETGTHGPWLIRVNSQGHVNAEQLAIAPLRWERFDLQVGEEDGPEDVGDRLLAEMVRVGHEIQSQGSVPKVLGLRPRLVGPTRHYDALSQCIKENNWNGWLRSAGETMVFIDKVLDGLELAHDLEDLAKGDDPPALMARKLLILRNPGEGRSALLEATRNSLEEVAKQSRWSVLGDERVRGRRDGKDPLADEALLELLSRSGTAALSELLSQRDRADASSGASR